MQGWPDLSRLVDALRGTAEMPEEWQPIHIGALLSIGLGYVWWERGQSSALRKAAAALGMTFGKRNRGLALPPFGTLIHLGKPKNVIRGTANGREVAVFEFSRGSRRHRHTQTAAAFHLAGESLPQFDMRPETGLDRVIQRAGSTDIDFGASEEFSRDYVLQGEDEPGIRSVFDQALLDYLARDTGWHVEGLNDWLLVYRYGVRESAQRLPDFIDESIRVAEAFSRA